jgi:hypothetical protein
VGASSGSTATAFARPRAEAAIPANRPPPPTATAEFGVDLVEAALEQRALRQDANTACLPVPAGIELAK